MWALSVEVHAGPMTSHSELAQRPCTGTSHRDLAQGPRKVSLEVTGQPVALPLAAALAALAPGAVASATRGLGSAAQVISCPHLSRWSIETGKTKFW
jgi:hypothetical protein